MAIYYQCSISNVQIFITTASAIMRRRKKSGLHVSSCKFDPENVRPFVLDGLEFVSGMDRNDYHDNIGLTIIA